MKIRYGFVSNSSSSSFILCRTSRTNNNNNNEDDDLTASITLNIANLIQKRIRTGQELSEWANEYYMYEDEAKKKILAKCEKIIQEGKEIIIGFCTNDDDGISLAIYENGLRNVKFSDKSVKIIEDIFY